MTTVAVAADLHIGAHGAYGTADAAYGAIAHLGTAIVASDASVVLIAGDVFDRDVTDERALAAAQQLFDLFAQHRLPVVVIAGNHDAVSPLPAQLRFPETVHWLSTETAHSIVLADSGLAVHGQSIGDADESRNLATVYPPQIPGLRNIGLLHTSLRGEWSRRGCAPSDIETLRSRGYDAWALGHVHQRMTLATDPLVFYPGGVYPHKPGESAPRGFAMLHLADANPTVEFIDLVP